MKMPLQTFDESARNQKRIGDAECVLQRQVERSQLTMLKLEEISTDTHGTRLRI